MNRHLANWMLVILLASFTISAHPCAAASRYKEDEIKVVLIYHFAKFIDWPPAALSDATPEFTLCIFGTSPLESALATIRGKPVKGRPVVIRKVSRPAQLNTCHTLFIGASALTSGTHMLAYVKNLPIITISDLTGFACMGGMFNFVRFNDTIGFEVNPKAARRVSLTIRSKLLRLAKTVVRCNVER
ncbi:YfiR family protein [Candidatus Entotheonella palauensis]|uniref:DUF4154 domain-containing protein n=1 Tax=Candidatus Entotheonella gemina TaxID=1429439 RepID=W4M4U6_9BACT|nr:YfiR family protein [Candidatus Entotheonella palauensis]ETX05208.1 MAG: hypothetical protein ETSY2_24325 [Candidatus Entotheonella gemina]